jgi:hypothetical protein
VPIHRRESSRIIRPQPDGGTRTDYAQRPAAGISQNLTTFCRETIREFKFNYCLTKFLWWRIDITKNWNKKSSFANQQQQDELL